MDEVGGRLKAFRLASGLRPEEVAARLGISRAGLYRYESGQVAKIETLERFAEMYGISVPTLLGIGVEYLSSAVAFFERLRQLEAEADEIVAYGETPFCPFASEAYERELAAALREGAGTEAERVVPLLRARRLAFDARRPRTCAMLSAGELSRLAEEGLAGAAALPPAEQRRRCGQAGAELRRLAGLLEEPPADVQLGILVEPAPGIGFELVGGAGRVTAALSPFRLGARPNIRLGVGLVTAAPEAVALHRQLAAQLWRDALKGAAAAAFVRSLVEGRET